MSAVRKPLLALGLVALLVLVGMADAALTERMLLPREDADAVARQAGPDVSAIAAGHGFEMVESREPQILERILPATTVMTRATLLRGGDRIATVAWVESPQVRQWMALLKEALRGSLSPGLQHLIDERQTEPDRPPRDVLSFTDPAIHTDRLLFARVRQRLYEFHITVGNELAIDQLLNALTK